MGHFGIVFLGGGPRCWLHTPLPSVGRRIHAIPAPYHNFLHPLRRQARKEQFDEE